MAYLADDRSPRRRWLFAFSTRRKNVILSGAPHRFTACHSACGAESKDPEGDHLTDAARGFSITEARTGRSRYVGRLHFGQWLQAAALLLKVTKTFAQRSLSGRKGTSSYTQLSMDFSGLQLHDTLEHCRDKVHFGDWRP